MSELFDYVYEYFPPLPPPDKSESYRQQYTREWNKAVERLKESGVDLSRIILVEKAGK